MDDLISRKALLAEYDRVHIGEPGKARKLIADAPKVDAVDLPHWATEQAYKNGYEQGKKDALKWISVTEQEEPTENGTYLCHGYWFGSRRKQTETADFFGEWNIANNFILTHWMPLPEPPKGE